MVLKQGLCLLFPGAANITVGKLADLVPSVYYSVQ